ncbi:MAG TPA: patatin-like phospholipase family protein, partial [Gemmatimonadaceae bacterium]
MSATVPPAAAPSAPPAPSAPSTGVPYAADRPPRGTYDADAVLSAEIAYLQRHRHPERDWDEVRGRLVGIALSGGGIRSATTNLGILQALSRMDVLPMVDYVSTVSGGGYVGACLSSLLSWNGIASPGSGGTAEALQSFTFPPDGKPHFTTSWRWFPFRARFVPTWSQVGRDVVAHLRTHGNFLIARWGMLRRESMRAIGTIVTGVLYNVTLFLVTLFAVAAVYLTGALAVVPEMPALFGPPDRGAERAAVTGALPALVDGDSAVTRERTVPCPAGTPAGATCVRETRTTLRPPSLWERAAHDAGVLGGALGGAWREWRA